MNITYTYGNSLPARPLIAKVKHGVTEISLSDGRIMRLTLHVESVEQGEDNQLEVSYQVISEIMREPELPILDICERIQ